MALRRFEVQGLGPWKRENVLIKSFWGKIFLLSLSAFNRRGWSARVFGDKLASDWTDWPETLSAPTSSLFRATDCAPLASSRAGPPAKGLPGVSHGMETLRASGKTCPLPCMAETPGNNSGYADGDGGKPVKRVWKNELECSAIMALTRGWCTYFCYTCFLLQILSLSNVGKHATPLPSPRKNCWTFLGLAWFPGMKGETNWKGLLICLGFSALRFKTHSTTSWQWGECGGGRQQYWHAEYGTFKYSILLLKNYLW